MTDREIASALAAEELLKQERRLHAETRRKLEKADHDRRRYKRRINTLDLRINEVSKEYRAAKDTIRGLHSALASIIKKYESGETPEKGNTNAESE